MNDLMVYMVIVNNVTGSDKMVLFAAVWVVPLSIVLQDIRPPDESSPSSMAHIPTKLHQFLTSSFRDFMRTNAHTDAAKKSTCLQHSWRTGNKTNVLQKCAVPVDRQQCRHSRFYCKSSTSSLRCKTSLSTRQGKGGRPKGRKHRPDNWATSVACSSMASSWQSNVWHGNVISVLNVQLLRLLLLLLPSRY